MRPKFLAFALLCLAPFARATAGDETIGTHPGQVDFVCVRSLVENTPTTIHRHIAGAPGTTITQQQGNLRMVASTDDWGTEEATLPPTVIVTSWTSGGLKITVTVTQGPNEPLPDFTRRVDATVRAMQNLRPLDGPATGPLPAWTPSPSVQEMIRAAEHWANTSLDLELV